jgi:hypothetical protein
MTWEQFQVEVEVPSSLKLKEPQMLLITIEGRHFKKHHKYRNNIYYTIQMKASSCS